MDTDVLSDLLRAVRLRGAVYFDYELAAPWVAAAPESARAAQILMPGVDHLIEYHVVACGECWTWRRGGEPIRLAAGDAIVYPQGDPHVMSSSPELDCAADIDSLEKARAADRLPYVMQLNRGRATDTALVCGFLGCDLRPFNPLIGALPREIHVSRAATQGDDWLGAFLRVTVAESRAGRPGGQNMLARMSELMFLEVIRRHLESLPPEQSGWLAGLRDRQVGRALALLHGAPARPWTIDDLAARVALSRSAFVERFTRLVGMPPMQYLTSWRMQRASELLVNGNQPVAAVAEQVGYDSEAAFSRAFRRLTGSPPASWRRSRSSPDGGVSAMPAASAASAAGSA